MTRVPTFAAQQVFTNRLVDVQARVFDRQVQVATEQKSQNYAGLASDSLRLVNFENERDRAVQFKQTNTIVSTRLTLMQSALEGVDSEARAFRSSLIDFAKRDLTDLSAEDQLALGEIQTRAFGAMKELEFYLNTKADGQFLFAGGRVETAPTDLPFATLDDFQAVYDGNTFTYPESRAAHLADQTVEAADIGNLSFAALGATEGTISAGPGGDFFRAVVPGADTGAITFVAALPDTDAQITAATAGAFDGAEIGETIALSDTVGAAPGDNDGLYRITGKSDDGTTLSVVPVAGSPPITDSAGPVAQGAGFQVGITEFPVGSARITVDGSNNNDSFTFRVTDAALDGSSITVSTTTDPPRPPVVEGPTANVTISGRTYYRGDELEFKHRVDDTASVQVGINAKDAAIEKAIRAMGIIAQGLPTDMAGDLDEQEFARRMNLADTLINDAIQHSPRNADELPSDLEGIQQIVGRAQVTVEQGIRRQETFIGFIDTRVLDIEQVDLPEAITRLNSDLQSLEISYAALGKITNLNLLSFIN